MASKALIRWLMLIVCINHRCTANQVDPHVYPPHGPFFEGWYLRVVDFRQRQSFGVIFGEVERSPERGQDFPPAFVGCLHSGGDNGSVLRTFDTFPNPADIRVTVRGGADVTHDPDVTSPAHFVWRVDGVVNVTVTPDRVYVTAGVEEAVFKLEVGPPVPWGPHGEGPIGPVLQYFPHLLPLNWFVYSTGSQVKSYMWQNTKTGEVFTGGSETYAHFEKNWGNSFPRKWIWAQGLSESGSQSFAITHGIVDIGPLSTTGFLIGYRNHQKDVVANFRNFDSLSRLEFDACAGRVELTLWSLWYKAEIRIQAQPASFSECIYGPEEHGFRTDLKESYVAHAHVTVWRRHMLFWWHEADQQHFSLAALEFGNEYVCGQVCNLDARAPHDDGNISKDDL